MKDLLDLLKNYGISLDESASGIISLIFSFLILLIIMLLNVVNIAIYLASIYIVSHEKFLSLIPDNYVRVHKLIN